MKIVVNYLNFVLHVEVETNSTYNSTAASTDSCNSPAFGNPGITNLENY